MSPPAVHGPFSGRTWLVTSLPLPPSRVNVLAGLRSFEAHMAALAPERERPRRRRRPAPPPRVSSLRRMRGTQSEADLREERSRPDSPASAYSEDQARCSTIASIDRILSSMHSLQAELGAVGSEPPTLPETIPEEPDSPPPPPPRPPPQLDTQMSLDEMFCEIETLYVSLRSQNSRSGGGGAGEEEQCDDWGAGCETESGGPRGPPAAAVTVMQSGDGGPAVPHVTIGPRGPPGAAVTVMQSGDGGPAVPHVTIGPRGPPGAAVTVTQSGDGGAAVPHVTSVLLGRSPSACRARSVPAEVQRSHSLSVTCRSRRADTLSPPAVRHGSARRTASTKTFRPPVPPPSQPETQYDVPRCGVPVPVRRPAAAVQQEAVYDTPRAVTSRRPRLPLPSETAVPLPPRSAAPPPLKTVTTLPPKPAIPVPPIPCVPAHQKPAVPGPPTPAANAPPKPTNYVPPKSTTPVLPKPAVPLPPTPPIPEHSKPASSMSPPMPLPPKPATPVTQSQSVPELFKPAACVPAKSATPPSQAPAVSVPEPKAPLPPDPDQYKSTAHSAPTTSISPTPVPVSVDQRPASPVPLTSAVPVSPSPPLLEYQKPAADPPTPPSPSPVHQTPPLPEHQKVLPPPRSPDPVHQTPPLLEHQKAPPSPPSPSPVHQTPHLPDHQKAPPSPRSLDPVHQTPPVPEHFKPASTPPSPRPTVPQRRESAARLLEELTGPLPPQRPESPAGQLSAARRRAVELLLADQLQLPAPPSHDPAAGPPGRRTPRPLRTAAGGRTRLNTPPGDEGVSGQTVQGVGGPDEHASERCDGAPAGKERGHAIHTADRDTPSREVPCDTAGGGGVTPTAEPAASPSRDGPPLSPTLQVSTILEALSRESAAASRRGNGAWRTALHHGDPGITAAEPPLKSAVESAGPQLVPVSQRVQQLQLQLAIPPAAAGDGQSGGVRRSPGGSARGGSKDERHGGPCRVS